MTSSQDHSDLQPDPTPAIESISAVTLATSDMDNSSQISCLKVTTANGSHFCVVTRCPFPITTWHGYLHTHTNKF